MFIYASPYDPNDNSRFGGRVTVIIGNQEHTIPASQFELAEANTRNMGDGDKQYEELWVANAPISEETGDQANFDSVHVNVIRFNYNHFEFYGQAEVVGGGNNRVQVVDELELNEPNEQDPRIDP